MNLPRFVQRYLAQLLVRPGPLILDERFPDKPLRLYKTPIGKYYLPADAIDDIIAKHMRAGRVFEPEIVETARQYITPGSTVIDVGASFGQMSLLFAKIVGGEGQVLSFEADDYLFSMLQRNLVANMAYNVKACLAAVWERSGQELFYPVQDFQRFKSYGSYGIDPNATFGRKVKTLAIDDLDIEQPISLMKVDAQGSDLFVLRGATATIRQHRMPIIFEYEEQFQREFGTTFQDYVNFVRSISYRFERTIYDINYLVVPDGSKTCATHSSADLETSNSP